MILLDHVPYAPFMQPRTARPPGLAPLEMRDWTLRHSDFAAQMAYRRRLLAERPDIVLGALPEGEEPALELLEMLLTHLGAPRPLTLEERFCALTAIGRLVAEDFCLLVPDAGSGEYRLAAAVLCFPSRWLLSEKLGRPLTAIHAPVPDYDSALARRVNRVFEALRPDRPLVRVNWLVHPTAELHLPLGRGAKRQPADPSGSLFLRTERQTLVRLPRTGAVAFGIKTSVTAIERLDAATARGLADALGALEPQAVAYRAGSALRDAAVARLAEIACAGAGQGTSLGRVAQGE